MDSILESVFMENLSSISLGFQDFIKLIISLKL